MENVFYLISAHSYCIEGIQLSKKSRNLLITGESIGFAASDTTNIEEVFLSTRNSAHRVNDNKIILVPNNPRESKALIKSTLIKYL